MTALQKARWILLGVTVLAVLSATPDFAAALPNVVYTFDENGHGSKTIDGGPPVAIAGSIKSDPGTGISTLFYPIPGLPVNTEVGTGFVQLRSTELGNLLISSDVVHFVSLGPSLTGVFFYSDPEEPAGTSDLADVTNQQFERVANLASFEFPQFVTFEVGSEGANSGFWVGLPFTPGFIPDSVTSYNFISDAAVPEPSSLILLAAGAGLAGIVGWRRRRK